MRNSLLTVVCCVVTGFASVAATKVQKRLTAPRIAELTAQTSTPAPTRYKIEVSSLGSATLDAEKLAGEIRNGKPLIFPTEFDSPQAAQNGAPVLTPTTPTAFITVDTGWTVRFSAKPHGKLLAVSGVAEYTAAKMLPSGYGAIAGPVYADNGDSISLNKLEQPRLETTATHFHLFALLGEPYEVILYKGEKAEKHTVAVSAE